MMASMDLISHILYGLQPFLLLLLLPRDHLLQFLLLLLLDVDLLQLLQSHLELLPIVERSKTFSSKGSRL
jgi:hypothetical protein